MFPLLGKCHSIPDHMRWPPAKNKPLSAETNAEVRTLAHLNHAPMKRILQRAPRRLHFSTSKGLDEEPDTQSHAPSARLKRRIMYYYDLCSCHKNTKGHPPSPIAIKALIKAAEDGCLVCSTVKFGLDKALNGEVDLDYVVVFKIKEFGELRIKYMKNGEWGTMRKFEMYLARDQTSLDKPLDGMGNFREVHENPLSEGCIERVKEMLDLCLQAHPMCNPTPSAYLPARVIDIGTDTSAPKLCALVLKKVNYVTLSHCWGAFQPLTTTKATLAERQEGIDWDALPKTFQEAIKLTRILGIRYIWIDSLCIVQDDR